MSLPGAVRNITHIAGGPRTAGDSSVTLPAGADSGVSMMPRVTVDNFPASRGEAGKYRANRPHNVEHPTVPIIHLSMDDVARLNGGKLPEKGGFLRKTAIENARRRLGLDRHSAVFIPASNVLRNGEEYVLKITKASLDKMFSPSDHSDVPVETVAIMENLERIANNGVYFKSEGDRKRRDQILGVDHLMTTVYIDNVPYIVDMRVRVAETGVGTHSNNVLYYFSPEEITTIKKADGSTPAAGRHASDGGAPPPTGITIPPMGGGVNIREMRSQGGAFQLGHGLGGQARKVELLPIRKVELLPVWGAQGGTAADPSGEIGTPNFVPLPIFANQFGARSTPALPAWGAQGGTAADPSGEIGAPNFVPLPIFADRLGARSTTALPMQGTKDGETVDNPGENGIIVGKGTEGAGNVVNLDEITSIYRAVGPQEYYNVLDSGKFSRIAQALQAKQFGVGLQDTINFAERYSDIAAVLEVKIPKTILDKVGDFTHVDTRIFKNGTISIQPYNLDEFNKYIKEILHIY
jgi:hypothetical protein